MKQRIAFLLLLAAILSLCSLPSAAATVSVADEILNLKEYYSATSELTEWEEVMAFASMGMLSGRIAVSLTTDDTASGLAIRILCDAARGKPKDVEICSRLAAMQKNGSFGSLFDHCMAMLALRTTGTMFNSARAFQWLTEQQNEDGSFGTTPKETSLALTVLSLSENESEQTAMNAAAKYFAAYTAQTESDLCWQIIGITDAGFDANSTKDRNLTANLLTYQNPSTYSYSDTHGTTEAEAIPTALALTAFDTLNRGASPCKRLAEKGTLSRYTIDDFRPLFIFGAVLLSLSVLFWIYVFLHKKNKKTLEETKTY